MPVQTARNANLCRLSRWLEGRGGGGEAQAIFLGNAVTARRLEGMAAGGAVTVLFARHIEALRQLRRHWMDDADAPMSAFTWTGIAFTSAPQGGTDGAPFDRHLPACAG